MIYVTILKQLQSDTDDITHHYTTFIPIHIGEEKNTAATIRTYITSLSLSYTTYLPKRVKMYKKNQYIHTRPNTPNTCLLYTSDAADE